jgi:hypothetical protein
MVTAGVQPWVWAAAVLIMCVLVYLQSTSVLEWMVVESK